MVLCTRCKAQRVKITSHPLCPYCYKVVQVGGGNVDHDKWKRVPCGPNKENRCI